jgi:hypothetical protein
VPLLTTQSAKGYGFSRVLTSAGITSDYESIQTYDLTSGGTGSVTFNSGGVFANYKHLQVRWIAKCSRSAYNATLVMTLNGNSTASNYVGELVEWDGTGTFYPSSGAMLGYSGLAGNTAANYYSIGYANIYDINSTNKNKPFNCSGVFQQGGTASGQNNWTMMHGSFIANTNAITSITFAPDIGTFNANTRIALYGIKG